MKKLSLSGLLIRVFVPAAVLIILYLIIGINCTFIPHILLFCMIGAVTMVSIELGIILFDSKRQFGRPSLKSAFADYQKLPVWQIILFGMLFFGVAGIASVTIQPLENSLMSGLRTNLLSLLPTGFDWTNVDYLKSFSKATLIFTCIFYGVFNIFLGPITEELFFRGYLTSHFKRQNIGTPILIAVLFSLYHFWLPFNNFFRIVIFCSDVNRGIQKEKYLYQYCVSLHM